MTYTYEWATRDAAGSFTVDERSESIAHAEAKMTLERLVDPTALVRFDLVHQGPTS